MSQLGFLLNGMGKGKTDISCIQSATSDGHWGCDHALDVLCFNLVTTLTVWLTIIQELKPVKSFQQLQI